MIKYDYKGHTGKVLLVSNKKFVFSVQIESAIADYFDDILIVFLRQPENKADENVYGINKDGDIVWELNKGNYLNLKHGFIQAYKDEGGVLWVINLGGKHFKIDRKTGKVLDTKYKEIDYDIAGNILHVAGKNIKFPANILRIFPFKDILVVFTKYIDDKYEHVFGVDKNGEIIWVFNKNNYLKRRSMFQNCYYRDKKWRIGNIDGYEYTINPKTGAVLEKEWLK